MGLIKAGIGALGGVLADQWKEFFYCEALDMDTLVVKGQKRVGGRSLSEKPGAVAYGGKHIHSLYQNHARRRRLDEHGILIVGETVNDTTFGVRRHGHVGKNLLQQLWSCLRRSAGPSGLVHKTEIRHAYS